MADDSPGWKQKPLTVGLLVLVVPPLGLYLLWKHPTWQQRTKWIATGCYAAFMIFASAASESENAERGKSQTASVAKSAAVVSTPQDSQPSTSDSFDKKYEALVYKIQSGMTQEQVEGILGPADEIKHTDIGQLNPQKVGQTLTMLTWRDGTKFILLGFTNGVLTSGGTPGYDIVKGFHGALSSDTSAPESVKLKKTLEKLGFEVDDK